MRYFTQVVEAGSLTAAAAALHLSQPALSIAIGRLETELGVVLLDRSPRGVEPTSAGRYLLDAAEKLLDGVAEISQQLHAFGSGLRGSVTIAAVPVLTWHWLPSRLRDHALQAPEVDITLIDPPPWQALELLLQRQVDLAAVVVADSERFAARHAPVLEVIDCGPVPLVAALPPGCDAPDPLPLAWFHDQTLLLPRRTAAVPSLPEAVDALFDEAGVCPARVRTVETIQSSLPLVEAGLATAILPDPGGRSIERFSVTVRSIAPVPAPLRALVLLRRGGALSPAAAGFVETIQHRNRNRV